MSQRDEFLTEMGYTLWRRRVFPAPPESISENLADAPPSSGVAEEPMVAAEMELPLAVDDAEFSAAPDAASPERAAQSPSAGPPSAESPFAELPSADSPSADSPSAGPAGPAGPGPVLSEGMARQAAIAGMDWAHLEEAVRDCADCALCRHRKQAVLGVGDRRAAWLFVGEGPGAEEDARGEPFVGQAGKLLDAMLAAIGLKRGENVYIANAVKCRPEGNRTPHGEEMMACRPFLKRQIALIQPQLIVLLGKAAMHSVLGEDRSLAAMRQKRFAYEGIPTLVTYHPAYLLRSLPEKAKAWEDLCFARRVFAELASSRRG